MNILVLLPVNDRHRAILESSAPGEDFIYTSADAATHEQVADADVILGNIDPDMLTACEHLQLLQLQTAGYDDYLAAGTVPADAKLSCSVGAYGQAVSEHMFAMVLSMMKRLPDYHDLQREHRWEDLGPVTSLKNANVLVLGAGDIGGHFATLCRDMGAHVRGIKRHPLVYPIVFEDMDGMDALSERLAEADIVASFMPSTPETRGLANAEFFAAMKPGAFFANGGRGDLVVADDLVTALESGHLAGAAVDVTDPEPLPETSPLWDAPNMLITPHISGWFHLEATLNNVVDIAGESASPTGGRDASLLDRTLIVPAFCQTPELLDAASPPERQSDVQSSGMAKRPMPSSFTSPCSLWRALADFCPTCGILPFWCNGVRLVCTITLVLPAILLSK